MSKWKPKEYPITAKEIICTWNSQGRNVLL